MNERSNMMRSLVSIFAVIGFTWAMAHAPAFAAMQDVVVTDVTTRSFAVVWVSDEAVTSADVRVFADADGFLELDVVRVVDSAANAESHPLGLVKVSVYGLISDMQVYIQAETATASGTTMFPAGLPLMPVLTAMATAPVTPTNEPVINDLIEHSIVAEDGVTPAPGVIAIVNAPELSSNPLSVIVTGPNGIALMDLNNLFDAGGVTAGVPADQRLKITEYRGGLCANLGEHRQVRFRRVPAANLAIAELVLPDVCFGVDTNCDDVVSILDLQWVLNRLGSVEGECAFHPDLDLEADLTIDILDVQEVLSRFGDSAPFVP